MGTQTRPVGEIISSLRRERGLTQERLAELANVDRRTVQRAEAGEAISAVNAKSIATALGVESTTLFGPHSITKLLELAEQLTCPRCGSPLAERTFVDHEYGDCEWDRFECGAEDGYRFRPCPKDPRFPEFEEYELMTYQEGELFYSGARGRSDMARAVELGQGFGRTPESAEKWVKRSYVAARYGSDAAERFLPWDSPR